ncbi:cytochrome c oxidase assembly protein [Galbitalea sp. SE-J8]|uniref:cytochrome c oxidase assembly protein n=1 Tax=Galbitalea sp. SE-J8 TaxID=3054952 RepID=UPI00259CE751|nr:cytochrome c oxidase assembly protein [Galbitalea sp. SE-J8]MDM4762302.1 cytochrome c oxidase assembly protein [Galbitalea sp. SE-J8]
MNRAVRIAAPAVLVLVAALAAIVALAFGGGANPSLLSSAGPVVRWGLPLANLLLDLGAAGTIGALVVATFVVAPKRARSADRTRADRGSADRASADRARAGRARTDEYGAALDVAAASAAIWTVAGALTAFLSFLYTTEETVSIDDRFGQVLGTFLTQYQLGQQLFATTVIGAVLTVLCFAVRNHTAIALIAIGAVLGLIPLALGGHAGGTADHDSATSAIYLHIAAAAIWVGGLATLAVASVRFGVGRVATLLPRYSSIALVCFVVVAISGYISAAIRVGTLSALATPYGVLVLVKVAALLALGLFGIVQRRFLIGRMLRPGRREKPWFWTLVVGELAFMGIASGVAAALARTATPVDEQPASADNGASPAEILTGSPLPPPVTPARLVELWNVDSLWLVVCVLAAAFYLAGVIRLRRRGDRWPIHRTVLWLLGLAALFYVTNGGVNVYERFLFSAHMSAHMALTMAVPVLLVPAAPITLALRAIHRRDDGSRGGREWILVLVHSRFFGILSNPIVAAVLFAGSLWVFYYSPLFRWATLDHVGHEWMTIHFLLTGYLFVFALVGVDPSPRKATYPMKLIVLLGTMAFHAFFGLSLLSGTSLLLADWYGAMGWGTNAIDDQQTGGGIAWGIGEVPTVIVAMIVAVQWYLADGREQKRIDRKADRDGDADLNAYNAMLARAAEHDARVDGGTR